MEFNDFLESIRNQKLRNGNEKRRMVSLFLLVKTDYPEIARKINNAMYGENSTVPYLNAGEYAWYKEFLRYLLLNDIVENQNGFQLNGKYSDFGESRFLPGLEMKTPCIYLDKEEEFFSVIGFDFKK